jgi:hypothetical protein
MKIDHEFLPVAGHSDDDECTHRADGTDATYCGKRRVLHDWDGYCKDCREWFMGRHFCSWDNA